MKERSARKARKAGLSLKIPGRLETVVTTPSPSSYCMDPFPLILHREEAGVSLDADFEASFALFEEACRDPS